MKWNSVADTTYARTFTRHSRNASKTKQATNSEHTKIIPNGNFRGFLMPPNGSKKVLVSKTATGKNVNFRKHIRCDVKKVNNVCTNGNHLSGMLWIQKRIFPSPYHTKDSRLYLSPLLNSNVISGINSSTCAKKNEILWKRTKKKFLRIAFQVGDRFLPSLTRLSCSKVNEILAKFWIPNARVATNRCWRGRWVKHIKTMV